MAQLNVTAYKGLDGDGPGDYYVVTIQGQNPGDPVDVAEFAPMPGYEDVTFAQVMDPRLVIQLITEGEISKGSAIHEALDEFLALDTTEVLWTAVCGGGRVQ